MVLYRTYIPQGPKTWLSYWRAAGPQGAIRVDIYREFFTGEMGITKNGSKTKNSLPSKEQSRLRAGLLSFVLDIFRKENRDIDGRVKLRAPRFYFTRSGRAFMGTRLLGLG